MNHYSLFNDIFDPYPLFGRSVYVISDSDWAAHKQKQLEREIAELERLQESYQQSIERVQVTIDKLRKDMPSLKPAEEQPSPA